MVLIGPPAEKPPGVPVDAGHMQLEAPAGETLLHQGGGVGGQGLEGPVQKLLKLLLMGQKPGPLVMKGQLPQKVAGLGGESFKHGKMLFLLKMCHLFYHSFCRLSISTALRETVQTRRNVLY